jgi:hypothetical protein
MNRIRKVWISRQIAGASGIGTQVEFIVPHSVEFQRAGIHG